MLTIAKMLRFEFLRVLVGLILLVGGAFGMGIYKPIPDTSDFTTPIPYNWVFVGFLIVGAAFLFKAWAAAQD